MALDLNKAMGLWVSKVIDLTDKEAKFVKLRIAGEVTILPIEILETLLSHVEVTRSAIDSVWESVDKVPQNPDEERKTRVREAMSRSKERDHAIEEECRQAWETIENTLPANHPRRYLTSAEFDAYKALDIQLSKHLKLMQTGMRVRVTTIVRALSKSDRIELPTTGYAERLESLLTSFLEEEAWGPRIHEAIYQFANRNSLRLRPIVPRQIVEGRKIRPQVGRSFTSVCHFVRYFLEGSYMNQDPRVQERRLLDALQDFNGIIREKDLAESVNFLTNDLLTILKKDVPPKLKEEVRAFLKELEYRVAQLLGAGIQRLKSAC